jgi:hypothetical protein
MLVDAGHLSAFLNSIESDSGSLSNAMIHAWHEQNGNFHHARFQSTKSTPSTIHNVKRQTSDNAAINDQAIKSKWGATVPVHCKIFMLARSRIGDDFLGMMERWWRWTSSA